MPFLRAEAPAGTPDEETIEYLLGQRHVVVKHRKKIKTIGELTEAERAQTELVHWGNDATWFQAIPMACGEHGPAILATIETIGW
ncbi:hypothetical protein PG997_000167 [Apiospora hydei]|uniref:Uncharacterized protein n=1 Tax=Apiospora hydei TaxID=1337664 RepID=A0ABR1XA81_9PEZI